MKEFNFMMLSHLEELCCDHCNVEPRRVEGRSAVWAAEAAFSLQHALLQPLSHPPPPTRALEFPTKC